VRTYIQSGNVVFTADLAPAARIPSRIAKAILNRFGFEVPVITRTLGEVEAIASNHPFLEDGVDTKTLHVVFLLDRPTRPGIAALDPNRSAPDTFAVHGREIYLRCPNGVARSKLTAQYFDSRLKTISTARNWSTVLKLLEFARRQ